jgi:hypothetical protein
MWLIWISLFELSLVSLALSFSLAPCARGNPALEGKLRRVWKKFRSYGRTPFALHRETG